MLSFTGTITGINQNPATPAMPNPPGSTTPTPSTPPDPGATVTVTITQTGGVQMGMNQTVTFQKSTTDANTYKVGQQVTFTGSI